MTKTFGSKMSEVKINDIILKFLLEVFFNVPFGSSFSNSKNLTGLINISHDFRESTTSSTLFNTTSMCKSVFSSHLCFALPRQCLALPCPVLFLPCLAFPCLLLPSLVVSCLAWPCLVLPCLLLYCLLLTSLVLPSG